MSFFLGFFFTNLLIKVMGNTYSTYIYGATASILVLIILLFFKTYDKSK